LAIVHDRAFGEAKVRLIGISAKGDRARANPGDFLNRINDRDIFGVLIFKNPQLGRAIIGNGAIAIEMVGSEIKPKTD
jgi:hypothetical protein